jgi:hypothetical protein
MDKAPEPIKPHDYLVHRCKMGFRQSRVIHQDILDEIALGKPVILGRGNLPRQWPENIVRMPSKASDCEEMDSGKLCRKTKI